VLGFVYPVSVDAEPRCFCDAAYDEPGTATSAASARAGSTLIFEGMRSPPTRVASWQTEMLAMLRIHGAKK
jgi:hypothetical protein